jgi:hypothetical protein
MSFRALTASGTRDSKKVAQKLPTAMFTDTRRSLAPASRWCHLAGVGVAALLALTPPTRTERQPLQRKPLTVRVDENTTVAVWLEASLKRVFLQSPPGSTNLNLLTARNAKVAIQACVHNQGAHKSLRISAQCLPEFNGAHKAVKYVSPITGETKSFPRPLYWLAPGQGALLRLE